ncbi:MAG: zinc ribbon-containing protein [Colwellia sp.]|nr:zinc ribbon-containing protein [Colwellia sp.]
MKSKNSVFQDLYQALVIWAEDVNQHEITDIVEKIEKSKLYLQAAEKLPEEKVKQFVDNLRFDIREFIQQNELQAKNSLYLGLLNESFWNNMQAITDKSQVEWSELDDDFKHHGEYKSGDFIGFGFLECQNCHEKITYSHASDVADCFSCSGNTFIRLPFSP